MNKDDKELMGKLSGRSKSDYHLFLIDESKLRDTKLIRNILLDIGFKNNWYACLSANSLSYLPKNIKLVEAFQKVRVVTKDATWNRINIKINELISLCKADEKAIGKEVMIVGDGSMKNVPYFGRDYFISDKCKRFIEVKKFFHFSEPLYKDMSCKQLMDKLTKKGVTDMNKLIKLKNEIHSLKYSGTIIFNELSDIKPDYHYLNCAK